VISVRYQKFGTRAFVTASQAAGKVLVKVEALYLRIQADLKCLHNSVEYRTCINISGRNDGPNSGFMTLERRLPLYAFPNTVNPRVLRRPTPLSP
jgi:hypothetical protein